jgi:hypothetical protein
VEVETALRCLTPMSDDCQSETSLREMAIRGGLERGRRLCENDAMTDNPIVANEVRQHQWRFGTTPPAVRCSWANGMQTDRKFRLLIFGISDIGMAERIRSSCSARHRDWKQSFSVSSAAAICHVQ